MVAATINHANFVGLAPNADADRCAVQKVLSDAEATFAEVPLSRVLRHQLQRLVERASTADGSELAILLREFNNNIMVELSSAWFLMIPAERRDNYEQRKAPFGDAVATTFANAIPDIGAASRCFALDEWTACVFHLMRALEHGLHALAAKVGLDPDAMAQENWKNVIDQIEKAIRAMEAAPKTPEKISRIQSLSSAAAQFRYFKDAWRNHASHAKTIYDQHEGERVWTHTKTFMEQMAAIP